MLGTNAVINIFAGGCISYIWGVLNSISSLLSLSLISLNSPGSNNEINSMVIGISQLDLLPSEKIYDFIFQFNKNDTPLNSYFDSLGFQGTNSI